MKRRIEPELMDEADQALAYAEADFTEPNTLFLRLLKELAPGRLDGARALDLIGKLRTEVGAQRERAVAQLLGGWEAFE